ncbi:putative Ig domain-containing protein, partial [Fodinibius salsisoli]
MKRIATLLTLVFSIALTQAAFAQTTISTGKYTTAATLDADANIYALQYDSDNDHYDVVKYDAPGYSSSTVLYHGVSYSSYPTDIEIASNGDVYFLDGFDGGPTNGQIITLDASNGYSSTVIASGDYYSALGIDSNDDIFVAQYDGSSTYEVVKYDVSNSYSTTVIFSGLGMESPYSRGLTIDQEDNIYVVSDLSSSSNDGTIYKLTSPGYSSSVIDSGEYYTGLAVDGHGDLFAMAYDNQGTPSDYDDDEYDVVKYTDGSGTPTVFHDGLVIGIGLDEYPFGLGTNRELGDLVVPDPFASGNGALYYYDRAEPAPSAPTANISGGLYTTDQTITLSGESGASIYYTLDGSTPTTASTLYAGSITISSTTTLKAIAVDGAGNASPELTETYTIDKEAPLISLLDGDTVDLEAGDPPKSIDEGGNTTVSDMDSPHFNGGYLEIVDRDANNTANGNFSVDGTNVTSGGDGTIAAGETIAVGGTSIGTVHATDDGQGGNNLTINFNTSDTTPARVQALIRNTEWTAPSGEGEQTFALTLADRAGNTRAPAQFTMSLFATGPDANGILYVDQNVSGGQETGDSWANALLTLTEALAYARDEWVSANGPLQIWIADGTYKPTDGTDRSASFRLTGAEDGLKIYGGFAGGESTLSQRDPATNVVTLSGNLNGDDSDGDGDGFPETNRGDNSYHVVYLDGISSPITSATVLDGVTISGGQADDGSFPDNSGGGLFCIGQGSTCSPTLANNTFRYNSASKLGGAMYNSGTASGESSPVITDVHFIQNRAASGAGVFNDGDGGASNPILTDVSFRDNRSLFDGADGNGAAIYNNGSGGQSSPVITNATFSGNHAERDGGAIFNDGRSDGTSDPQIVNAVFTGNSSDSNGGGVYSIGGGSSGESSPTIINATFMGNSASADGGGLVNDVVNGGAVTTTLQNTILHGNSAGNGGQQIYNRGSGANPVIGYTLVEGGSGGITNSSSSSTTYTDDSGNSVNFANSTNIVADPNFADSSDPDGADNQLGTADDGLQLTAASGAVNAGDPDTDLALFPNGPASPLDLTGAPRVYSGTIERIDMGAYELQAEQDINEAPSFTSSPVTAAEENASYSYQITTQDPDGDGLTITSIQIPDWATLTDNGDGTGTLEGTPAFDDSQDYTVELEVSDGELSATQSFTITVDNTNRSPVFNSSPVTGAKEGEAYSYTIEASDPDGNGLTITSVQIPDWATLTDNGDGTGTLEGTPAFDDSQDYTVELEVSDGELSATQSFTITVDNTNRPPVFDSSPVTAAKEGEAYSYTVEASDPDGDGLSFSVVQIPDWASLQDNGDGTATLSGTPAFDDSQDYTVELEVSDGELSAAQSFTITVGNTNRPPVFDSSPVTGAKEGEAYSYTVEASDPDGDGLSFSVVQIPDWASLQDNGDGTGTLSGTPGPEDMGEADVELEVSDGTDTASQSFTITVDNTNRVPAFDSSPVTEAKEGEAYNYTVQASDPDGDAVTITPAQLPDWASLSDNGDGTGTLSGTPGPEDAGNVAIELTVSDGSLSATQSFTITVSGTNRAPSFDSSPGTKAQENKTYSYTITSSDPDGDGLTITASTVPNWVTFTDNGDGTAILEGTPGPEDSGDHAVELQVSDGAATASQSFTITVDHTNRAPSFDSSPVTKAQEQQVYQYEIIASDPDGDGLAITATQIPDWASFTDNGDGTATLSGTPGPDDMGEVSVELEVSDGTATASQSFTITVGNTNRPPAFNSSPVTGAKEGEAYNYTVQASDPDGEAVTLTAPTIPDWASLTDNGDGTATLSGTPGVEAEGRYPVELVVSDGSADTTQV